MDSPESDCDAVVWVRYGSGVRQSSRGAREGTTTGGPDRVLSVPKGNETMKLTLSFSESEEAILKAMAVRHKSSPAGIAKDVLSVWFADRRAERRYQAEASH